MKLTAAQVACLKRMASGDEVVRFESPGSNSWRGQKNWLDRVPSIRTLQPLTTAGLVSRQSSGAGAGIDVFAITPAGRSLLESMSKEG